MFKNKRKNKQKIKEKREFIPQNRFFFLVVIQKRMFVDA